MSEYYIYLYTIIIKIALFEYNIYLHPIIIIKFKIFVYLFILNNNKYRIFEYKVYLLSIIFEYNKHRTIII